MTQHLEDSALEGGRATPGYLAPETPDLVTEAERAAGEEAAGEPAAAVEGGHDDEEDGGVDPEGETVSWYVCRPPRLLPWDFRCCCVALVIRSSSRTLERSGMETNKQRVGVFSPCLINGN